MISAFGIDHGISKAFTPKKTRLTGMMRGVHPGENMRQRAETNYIQNRLAAGLTGPMFHKPAKEGYGWAQGQMRIGRRARQETKAWETAANNMNRRKPGTGIGRMEAAASAKLKPVPEKKKRWWKR